MKILITGGAGFIGSNFVCYALNNGHSVVNIDALTYAGNLENLAEISNNSPYTFYKEDICNFEEISDIFIKEEPDVVIHMAAESHVDRSIDNPQAFIKTNINGTHSMLEAALKYYRATAKPDFRFLHLSTDEVFGALGSKGEFSEESPYRPNSPYAASKAASDLLVRSYYKTYGFPAIVVNSSNNYGFRQFPEKLIPLMILNALDRKSLPVYGDGKQVRDWLFVEDHVEALLLVAQRGAIGETYCIGSHNEMANIDLVTLICETLNAIKPCDGDYKDLITYVKDRPGHDFRYAINCSKIKATLGWSARTSFEAGIEKTIRWYIQHHHALRNDTKARERIGVR